MEYIVVKTFLNSLITNSLISNCVFDETSGRGSIRSDRRAIHFAIRPSGFIVSERTSTVEKYCPNPEASLTRELSSRLFGIKNAKFKDKVYQSVSVFPTSITKDGVMFETANGKKFLGSSSNCRVTLGLYDILYSRNSDQSILMLPDLLPSGSDTVKIASSLLPKCYITPKNTLMSSTLSMVTPNEVVVPADLPVWRKINSSYFDNSRFGDEAPTVKDLISVSSDTMLRTSNSGYLLSASLELQDVRYSLNADIRPALSEVRDILSSVNAAMADLKTGVPLSMNPAKTLTLLKSSKVASDRKSTLSYIESIDSSARVSKSWKIPILTENVRSIHWSY